MNAQTLSHIKGSLALVGPALVYHDNQVSVMVASGEPGSSGTLHELILGDLIGDLPSWTDAFDSVITLRGATDLTISEAREMRLDIVKLLRGHRKTVEEFDTDVALSIAYADRFPSPESRQILNEVVGAQVCREGCASQPAPTLTLTPRTTSDAGERAKLTPKLRYDVLLRDNFRCRVCGFGVESGAHLHIDHVHPISGGGRTEYDNLQALCSVCNQGKGARL